MFFTAHRKNTKTRCSQYSGWQRQSVVVEPLPEKQTPAAPKSNIMSLDPMRGKVAQSLGTHRGVRGVLGVLYGLHHLVSLHIDLDIYLVIDLVRRFVPHR